MSFRYDIVFAIAAFLQCHPASAEETVTTYVNDGWDIKGVTQLATTGRTQIILQKGKRAMICTIYFSVPDKGWIPQGCDPMP
jgi:hypothetical protein